MAEQRLYIYNFPISYLPKILDCKDNLRGELMDYGVYYAMMRTRGEATLQNYNNTVKAFSVKAPKATEKQLKELGTLYDQRGNLPHTHISSGLLWHFVNNYKTPTEVVGFVALLALRSIAAIGVTTTTTKSFLFARMSGKSIPDEKPNHHWCEIFKTQKNFAKVRKWLEGMGVKFEPGHHRGLVFTLTDPSERPKLD